MLKKIITATLLLFPFFVVAQQVQWVSTSANEKWKTQKINSTKTVKEADLIINPSNSLQLIEGFGTCFNELGWTSLNLLPAKDREAIMKELFAPGAGANFTICRMPVGANDFSRAWYSYNETDGDFDMKHFSIANDLETLVPFIKNAQKYNPALKIWASPWSPPSWMKYNHHYAARSVLGNSDFKSEEWGMDLTGINNGLPEDKQGKEGTDMFIQEERYYKAYALYFEKFIKAYRAQKINISMVMPQNEFNSAQVFPSCTWTAKGLASFVSQLAPHMKKIGVTTFLGTVERGNEKLCDTVLQDAVNKAYVKGAGFQWAGKDAIAGIHQRYPQLQLYQTEQECGNSKNDWKYCQYAWTLLKHYLESGANAYMYWNTSLKQGGISTWGWKQNSLVSVDTLQKTFTWNYEYYLLKHVSHFVKPGAKLLKLNGAFTNALAFRNPDKSLVVVINNESTEVKKLAIQCGAAWLHPELQPGTFNTFLLKQNQ
jgi:glucosylceramidase